MGAISPFWQNGLENDPISLPKAAFRSGFTLKGSFCLKGIKIIHFYTYLNSEITYVLKRSFLPVTLWTDSYAYYCKQGFLIKNR